MASAARCSGVRRSHSALLTLAAKKSSHGTMTAPMARATASARVLLPEPLRPSMATTSRCARIEQPRIAPTTLSTAQIGRVVVGCGPLARVKAVLIVADLLHPVGGLSVELFLNCDVGHGGSCGGAVPVLLTRRNRSEEHTSEL